MIDIKKAAVLVAVAASSGCAGLMQDNRTPEEIVAERAQERYDGLMQKNMEGLGEAFKFTTPSFRQYTTPEQYNARVAGRGMWNAAKVNKVTCEEDVCDVVIDVTYTSPQLGLPITRPLDEKWIRIENEWWVYHK